MSQEDLEPVDDEMLRAYAFMSNFGVSWEEYENTPEYVIDYLLAINEGQKLREKRQAEISSRKAKGKPLRTT